MFQDQGNINKRRHCPKKSINEPFTFVVFENKEPPTGPYRNMEDSSDSEHEDFQKLLGNQATANVLIKSPGKLELLANSVRCISCIKIVH